MTAISTLGFHSLLVIRHGYVVLDVSTYPFRTDQRYWMYSVTKSVISTLVGIAIDQGYLDGVDQSIWDFFSKDATANMDANKEAITLKHLLTHTPGFKPDVTTSMYELTAEDQSWVQYTLDQPMIHAPGDSFNYSDANPHLLSAILQQVTGMSAFEYAQKNLFEPLGITNVTWQADPQGVTWGGDGLAISPHDLAKLGYLYLHGGEWDGQQIVSPAWIEAATNLENASSVYNYGYLWWNKIIGARNKQSVYAALGLAGQSLIVMPDLDLIYVTTGSNVEPVQIIAVILANAAVSDAPLPANSEAQAALQAVIEAFSHPMAAAVPAPPALQEQVSGQTYTLEENELGWTSLALTFGEQEALLTLDVQGRRMELPVGLDGTFRVSTAGLPGDVSLWRPVSDVPLALKGVWNGQRFVISVRDTLGTLQGDIVLWFDDKMRVQCSRVLGLPSIAINGEPQ